MSSRSFLRDPRFWLGVVISAVSLWFAFRSITWDELAKALRAVDGRLLALATLVAVADQALRGVRWRVLVRPVADISTADAFSYLSIGALANALLPLRAGELVRPALLGEKRGLSKSALLGTVVVERVLDVVLLAALALLLLELMPIPTEIKTTLLVLGGGGLVALAGLWWAAGALEAGPDSPRAQRLRGWGQRLAGPMEQPRRVLGVDLRAALRRIWPLLHRFTDGLGSLRSPRLAGQAWLLTMLAWGASIAYNDLVLRACGLHLPWTASLMALVLINLGAAAPSTPGGLGIVQAAAVLALTPWHVADAQAGAFAVLVHAVVYLVMVGIGFLCLWREGLSLRAVGRKE